MSTYPSNILVKADVANEVDEVDEGDHNILKGEIIALQTYVGTNPQGSKSDLTTRLAIMISTNGAINGSNGFPANTTPMRLFYRTDQETLYIRRYDNAAEQAIGGSLSNVIYSSNRSQTKNMTTTYAAITSTSILGASLSGTQYSYWGMDAGNTYSTCHPVIRWPKISGVSTMIFKGNIWQITADGQTQLLELAVGTATGTVSLANTQTPTEVTVTVDLTGLGNGTYYDIVISQKRQTTSSTIYLGEFTLIGQ